LTQKAQTHHQIKTQPRQRSQPQVKAQAQGSALRDHLILAKPGIVLLVLVVALAGMYVGQRGMPAASLIFFTLTGIGLATAGSAVLNNYFDRDIDGLMPRTMYRALPQGRIYPANAFLLGSALIVVSVLIFYFRVNGVTAFLTFLSAFIYVVPYTILMKRRTHLVTHVGSITGALPPVIGYTAVRGRVGVEAAALFAIMFVWQHPHFWALALKYKDDYKRGGIPALPVSKGVKGAKLRTLISCCILLPVSLWPYFIGMSGVFYLVLAAALGAFYIYLALKFYLSEKEKDRLLYVYSIVYISALFTGIVLDMAGG